MAAVEATVVDHRLWEPELVSHKAAVPELRRTLQHRPSVELVLVEVDLPEHPQGGMLVVHPEVVTVIMEAAIRLRTAMVDRVVLREVSRMPVQVVLLVLVPVQAAEVDTLWVLDLHRVDRVVTMEVTLKK